MLRTLLLLFVSFASVLLLQACGDTRFTKLAGDLASTGAGCSTRVAKFYDNLNDAHRDMYGKEIKVESEADLPAEFKQRQRSGLIDEHPIEYKALRVNTALIIENYCTRIHTVISSKNTAQADQAVSGLNSQLQNILGEVLKVPKIGNWPINSLSNLAAPISTVGGMGVTGAVGFMKENWAKNLIKKSDRELEDVCDRLKIDLDNDAGEAKQRASRLVGLYKRRFDRTAKDSLSPTQREQMLVELQAMGKYQSEVGKDNPSDVFEKIKQQYHGLAVLVEEKSHSPGWQLWRKASDPTK